MNEEQQEQQEQQADAPQPQEQENSSNVAPDDSGAKLDTILQAIQSLATILQNANEPNRESKNDTVEF